MVCSFGSGRMEVMARLIASGSFSQNVADDFTQQKYSTGYICRELLEADEANLLDVEDMHVYGEKPMTDPLQLVCCNVCKKPIKDSQYASHAELCRSLTLTEPASLKHNGSTRKQKSARKEKKKLSTSCATTAVGKRRRAESMDNIDTAVSQSNLNGQIRATSFSIEAKGEDLLEGTALEHGSPDHKSIGLVHEQHVTSNDFPAPLATKIYYQQRSNRFRAAIRHLYFQDSSEDTGT